MDGWTVDHWIESNDAITPEEYRHGKVHSPCLANAYIFFFFSESQMDFYLKTFLQTYGDQDQDPGQAIVETFWLVI